MGSGGTLELWGRKNAYNVQKVLWTLDELGLNYRHHDIGSQAGDLETPGYLAINPHARIPTLVDAGAPIWESNSIIRYLVAEYGGSELCPAQPLARSYAERWMDWELAELQPDFIDLFWGYYRTSEGRRDAQAIDASRRRCAAHFRLVDEQLARHPYLAGENFSIAEITVATCLYRYFTMGLEVEAPQRLWDWYQRLCERSAYQDTIMQPYDELFARSEF